MYDVLLRGELHNHLFLGALVLGQNGRRGGSARTRCCADNPKRPSCVFAGLGVKC